MSKYTIFLDGAATEYARSTKATVIAEADRLRTKDKVRDLIEVRTDKGTVVHALKAVKARVITRHTKAYTKTITLPEDLAKLVPAGYVAAYERPRNDAVVLRSESAESEDRYAVARRSTGEVVAYVPTTRDAGQVMKGMKVPANA
jgi:hypothetical protein